MQKPGRFAARQAAVAVAVALACLAGLGASPSEVSYAEVPGWGRLPGGQPWAAVAGMAIDAKGTVFAVQRANPPVVELDTAGRVLKTWGETLFVQAHGVRVDRDGYLWITDYQAADGRGAQVYKYTVDGRLVMTIGRPGGGQGPEDLSGPADVAVAPNGDVFVADGHGSNRIHKYTRDGRFIKAWGRKGAGIGEFNIAHCVVFDSRGRLFVCDPINHRIQIFDQDGQFLEQWAQFGSPSGLFIAPDDTLYAADNCCSKAMFIGSARDGSVRSQVPGAAEGVAAGADGAVYLGEVTGRTVRKLVRN